MSEHDLLLGGMASVSVRWMVPGSVDERCDPDTDGDIAVREGSSPRGRRWPQGCRRPGCAAW
jgi:hypothetical protein